ncbi:MAG TPA: PKD domain-containing protein [Methylomirabilota bacterium]|nr:PKD domain-containing protein [Methylomirabilota bacterium]
MRRLAWIVVVLLAAGIALADDGTMFRKNVSNTPELETEHAALRMLPLYLPAQSSDGTLLGAIDYLNADGAIAETRELARPLIVHYVDGHVEGIDEDGYGGFPGHGKRDAFGAVSLDDGATWQRANLSRSANRSSVKIDRKPYPGDVLRSAAASDGNKVLIVWASKYCGGGSPNYAMSDDEIGLLEAHFGFTAGSCTDLFNADGTINNLDTPCLYMEDYFGVAGSQGVQSASDLAAEGFPLIGDYPYSCMWAARGVILPPEATGLEMSRVVWFKAERLSSGTRSADRPEAACVKGAGCVVTWQEDPDGVRPGGGEGPGEGWAGAIAHHETDSWYSYIGWDDLGLVAADDGGYGTFYDTTGDLAAWAAANVSGSPTAAVPMSIPVRLTDNAMCTDLVGMTDTPYCYADFDGSGTADLCAATVPVTIETPIGTQDVDMCVTEDGRLLRGNTAATRARLALHGYSSVCAHDPAAPDACPIDRAWFSMAYEENKGLGEDGEAVEVPDDPALKVDMGKNIWYHTFDMARPELVSQGLMLNQPSVYPDDWSDTSGLLTQDGSLGYNFYDIEPDPIYETQAGLATTLYQTEICRRSSPITQNWYDAGDTGTVAFQVFKQGIIRRGGPADIMARRFVIPDDFDATVDNPYGYANMVCENADGASAWAFADGSNPRYVKGLCAAPTVNLSANTILTGECGDATACLDAFPFSEYFDDLAGGEPIPKVWTWQQDGADYGGTPDVATDNLDDVSWENPYDVAKGHRGFLAGDMLMVLYAWAPNWQALTEAHDAFNLYIRRSFDGGRTFTTLPGSFTHTDGITYSGDGTTTCEWMLYDGASETPECLSYAAGAFEPARNVSQLVGSAVTIIDPRYAPTTASITESSVNTGSLPAGFSAPLYPDDTRDPSRYFIVYETGANSPYDVGEAEPLNLYYGRGVDWGDDYLVWQDEPDTNACLPSADTEDEYDLSGFCNEFDALEGSQFAESGEAAVTASPGGMFMYADWNQVDFDVQTGDEVGSDAWLRRVLFLDDYIPPDTGGTGPGNAAPGPSFTYAVDGLTVTFTDASSDADGTVVDWLWDFGDGQGSTERHPVHTYPAGGAYTVTLTVTDDLGATASTASTVVVSAPATITLTAVGYLKGPKQYADLAWSGATSSSVDVVRDGATITTTPNDGAHTDKVGGTGPATYVYRVCEASTQTCSNQATVVFD